MIKTTVNIDSDIFFQLNSASANCGLSVDELISILFKKMLYEKPMKIKIFSRVNYQKKKDNCVWHPLHVSLNEGSYEACIDMRKLFKMSVSFILSVSVEMYLKKIVHDSQTNKDNCYEFYRFLMTHSPNESFFIIAHTPILAPPTKIFRKT